jgi:hypothetical protein
MTHFRRKMEKNSLIWDGWFFEICDSKCEISFSKLVLFELIKIKICDFNISTFNSSSCLSIKQDLLNYKIQNCTTISVTPELMKIFEKYEIIKEKENIFIGKSLRGLWFKFK